MSQSTFNVTQIDETALSAYLSRHVPGFKGPAKAHKAGTGQSNPTYILEAASGKYVVRRKPPGPLLKSAHQVDREYTVMKALHGTGVPVPKMYHLCMDTSVLGTEFFVMECLDGRIFWDPKIPEVDNAQRAGIYDAMNKAIAALAIVKPEAVGLADFGRPGNYYARQIKRWSDQYRGSETVKIPDMDFMMDWLPKHMPAEDNLVSVVHGDYRLDNMIFHPTKPEIMGVVDWELSTLGHPFADIAYQCMQWRIPGDGEMRSLGGIDRKSLGIPTEEEYVAKFCERTGFKSIPNWNFYLAYNMFRLAAIVQGVYKRGVDGNASNRESALQRGKTVPIMAKLAVELVEKGA
jgi:aminoglycoside phosphotransferase (APT) family kinase protein